MKFFRSSDRVAALLLLGVVVPTVAAQGTQQANPPEHRNVTIRSIRVIPGETGCALEIISDHPLVPEIGKLDNPARIVIDLPNARLASTTKRLAFQSSEVRGVRIGQFQGSIARIVVDLAQPLDYSWDAAGNRLLVRMHPAGSPPKASSVPSLLPQAAPAFVPVAAPGVDAVTLAGNRLAGGSSITAGADTAILSLGRGGEIKVCPGTTVSVTPSENGRSLMLGMSTGSLEAHYRLDATSDSILTPDFRMLLAGSSEFHYAISVDPRGNTCVQALPGNTASLIVSEVLGDGTYQVKPAEQVMFHSGQLRTAAALMGIGCGCPAPSPAMMQASSRPVGRENASPQSGVQGAKSAIPNSAAMDEGVLSGPETAALPPTKPQDVHVQVDVPFVYRATDSSIASQQYKLISLQQAQGLPLRKVPRSAWLKEPALPPPRASAARHGFLGKVKGFFSAIFG
jgi:AMIN domain